MVFTGSHRTRKALIGLVGLQLSIMLNFASANTYIDCFASLPSSFVLNNDYQYQSSAYCSSACNSANYAYFALSDHSKCYCGNDNPASSESVANTCDTYCFGYQPEMCGGSNSFSVYQIADNAVVVSRSSSSSRSRSTLINSNSRESTSSTPASSTANDANTQNSEVNTDIPSSTLPDVSSTPVTINTSVIFSTQYITQGGSTIFTTNTITQVATSAVGSFNSTDSGNKNTSGSKKKSTGAIVGGVVGGVGGAIAIAIVILFIVRHVNKKKEEERMEKEYQEAIKPVEYPTRSNSVLSKNTNDHVIIGAPMGFNKSNSDYYSSSFSSQNNDNDVGSNNGSSHGYQQDQHEPLQNHQSNESQHDHHSDDPFDDSRRISVGSIFDNNQNGAGKILTIVNPDEED